MRDNLRRLLDTGEGVDVVLTDESGSLLQLASLMGILDFFVLGLSIRSWSLLWPCIVINGSSGSLILKPASDRSSKGSAGAGSSTKRSGSSSYCTSGWSKTFGGLGALGGVPGAIGSAGAG